MLGHIFVQINVCENVRYMLKIIGAYLSDFVSVYVDRIFVQTNVCENV